MEGVGANGRIENAFPMETVQQQIVITAGFNNRKLLNS